MHLVGGVAELLTIQQFGADILSAGCGEERRKPVKPGDDAVFDLAGGHLARPTDHGGGAESTFHDGALAHGKRRLSAIGPSEVLRSVVGGEHDNRIVVDAGSFSFCITS